MVSSLEFTVGRQLLLHVRRECFARGGHCVGLRRSVYKQVMCLCSEQKLFNAKLFVFKFGVKLKRGVRVRALAFVKLRRSRKEVAPSDGLWCENNRTTVV